MSRWSWTCVAASALICAACLLACILGIRPGTRTATPRSHPAMPTALGAPDNVAASPQADETRRPVVESAREASGASTEDLIQLLARSVNEGDVSATLRSMVELGRRCRSESGRPEADKISSWIQRADDARLIGLLAYVLAGYSTVGDGFFADLIASPRIPVDFVPGIAIGETLAKLPDEWDSEKQEQFWYQFLLCNAELLPSLRESYWAEHPTTDEWSVRGAANNLVQSVQKTRVEDPQAVRSILRRASDRQGDGWTILRRLYGYFGLSTDAAAAEWAGALSQSTDPNMQREIVLWLGLAPPKIVAQEVQREYDKRGDAVHRRALGTMLITLDRSSGPEVFRRLWTSEKNEDVQIGLVRAVGSLRLRSGLEELRHAYQTGSQKVQEVVREEVYAHMLDANSADMVVAKSLVQQIGEPANAPRGHAHEALPNDSVGH